MLEFFTEFFTADTIMMIPVFVVLLAIAIKEVVDFCDWLHDRGKKHFDKEDDVSAQLDKISSQLAELDREEDAEKEWVEEKFEDFDGELTGMNSRIDMLIDSDKEDIRAYILEKWTYYCQGQNPIDERTMECLETRYLIYKSENGNSFVHILMEELREWHKQCTNNPEE